MIRLKARVPKARRAKRESFNNALKGVGDELAKRVHKTYGELVADWRVGGRDIDTRPVFVKKITLDSRGMKVEVKTDSLKYRFVNLGTKEHEITPRADNPHGMLIFPSEFTPRTTPQTLDYDPDAGKNWEGPIVVAPHVYHPGIKEPRMFEIPIIEEQTPLVMSDLKMTLSKRLGKLVTIETETL